MNTLAFLILAGVSVPAVHVAVDATQPGARLPNTSQALTFWNGVMQKDRPHSPATPS